MRLVNLTRSLLCVCVCVCVNVGVCAGGGSSSCKRPSAISSRILWDRSTCCSRYSVYLLHWYTNTNTDAAATLQAVVPKAAMFDVRFTIDVPGHGLVSLSVPAGKHVGDELVFPLPPPGFTTQFTCFTSTKAQRRTPEDLRGRCCA